jgi:hypothetical protein
MGKRGKHKYFQRLTQDYDHSSDHGKGL